MKSYESDASKNKTLPTPEHATADAERIKDRIAREQFSYYRQAVLERRREITGKAHVGGLRFLTRDYINSLASRGIDTTESLTQSTAVQFINELQMMTSVGATRTSLGALTSTFERDPQHASIAYFAPESQRSEDIARPGTIPIGGFSIHDHSNASDSTKPNLVYYSAYDSQNGIVVERHGVTSKREPNELYIGDIPYEPAHQTVDQSAINLERQVREQYENEIGISAVSEGEMQEVLTLMASFQHQ